MSSFICHQCGKRMADSLAACPHCGAVQDAKSRADSARQNIEWIIVAVPTALGALAGWLLIKNTWAIVGLSVAGLVLGLGIVAGLYVMEHKK